MTQMTDFMENKLADFVRNQGLTLPSAWFLTPLSAWSDSSATEITGIGLSRVSKTRSLANFSGSQGDGSTLASSGTTHTSSNNTSVAFGTASSGATMSHVGLFDAASGGQCWMGWELETPLVISASDVVTLAPAQIKFSLGLSGGLSDFLSNALIDLIFRGQAYSFPAVMYHALYTSSPGNADAGVEIGGGVGYGRASLACSLAAISGTQSAGSTVASSGTSGEISNNVAVTHPQPSGSWSTPTHGGWRDASSAGNLLFHGALTNPTSISATSPPPSYAPGVAKFRFA